MRKRTRFILLAVMLLLTVLGVALYLRAKAPPAVARLLPEADAIVYVDLRTIRSATHFDQSQVSRSPSYQVFIDATGIVAERDVDHAAFALHREADPHGPNGGVAYSEVIEGRFDAQRLAGYLGSLANAQESYAGRTIYAIPSEGRVFRVAILGKNRIAASNAPTAEQIHSMLDRDRAWAAGGSSLLEARYGDVPAFSPVWGVGDIGLPLAEGGRGKIAVMGLELPVPADATLIASLRVDGAVRIDELTPSSADAEHTAKSLSAILNLLRGVQKTQVPNPMTAEEVQVRAFTDSIVVAPDYERVTLTAKLPIDVLKHVGLPR